MKYTPFFILLLYFISASAYVPGSKTADSLLHKTYAQRYMNLLAHYAIIFESHDSAMADLNLMAGLANKNNDRGLALDIEVLRAYYLIHYNYTNQVYCLALLDSVRKETQHEQNLAAECTLESVEADYWLNIKRNYEQAFDHTLKEYYLMHKMKDEDYPGKRKCLLRLVDYYYLFQEYANAIPYLKELLQVTQPPPVFSEFISATNTIGLCYQKMGNPDSARYYFERTYQLAVKYNEPDWKGIANGNIAGLLFRDGKYDEAIPLLENDVTLSVGRRDFCGACSSQMMLANINLKHNNTARAAELLNLSAQWIDACGHYDHKATLFPLLSKLYSQQGKSALAILYLDSAIIVKDSLTRRYNILQLARVKQRADLEHYNEELANVETEKRIKTLQRNALIAVMLVLLALALYIYYVQRKRHMQQQVLSQLELKNKEQQLAAAQIQLDEFARNISDKSRLVEELQQQMNGTANAEIITQLQQKTILTDEEWEHFRGLFEKVHAGFLVRLREKLPGLTPAEERFMAMAKLRFNIKEMAAVLGVSQQAVRNIWYRLRKKINLPEEGSVEELVEKI